MPGEVINSNNNFQSFLPSLLTLIRVTTGDNWTDIMNELAEAKQGCRDTQTWAELVSEGPKGCGGNLSYWYFVSFVMVNNMVIFNLFIAVVVESFMTHTEKLDDVVEDRIIFKFYQLWGKYDRNIEYRVLPWQFVLLMLELDEPLGIKKEFFHEPGKTQNYYTGNIYFSHDCAYYADDKLCIKALAYLNIEARGEFINIIDAIKLICKRAVVSTGNGNETWQGIKESGVSNNNNNLEIGHKFFVKKLNQKFFAYNKQYENLLRRQSENSAFIVARNVIKKFMRNWREKRNIDKNEENKVISKFKPEYKKHNSGSFKPKEIKTEDSLKNT